MSSFPQVNYLLIMLFREGLYTTSGPLILGLVLEQQLAKCRLTSRLLFYELLDIWEIIEVLVLEM